ncbi:MAG TPA: hypothetical protein VKE51_38825 [Vicinamibacterales bacterium]|nr:hypothetical protein [Vicinamibacterales bacterium]
MERLFSMFPRSAPGVALLLVRAGVAASILAAPPIVAASAPAPAIATGFGVVAAAVMVGFMTPVAAAVCALFGVSDLVALGPSVSAVVRVADAVALALLGPGAYSVDAWMFGRRVLVSSDHSKE